MELPLHHPDLCDAQPIRLARIEIWVCRAPLETPVQTSFGVMNSRPAVFVRLEDNDGAFGFGEVWCNFPACGAEHRGNLIAEELAPLALENALHHPSDLFRQLTQKVRIRSLQAGELGPYCQAIAGLDIALWDLFARRLGTPVRKLLDPNAGGSIPSYASGIHIRQADDLIPKARIKGYSAFKVKVGFELADDISRTREVAADLCDGERLFADANQAWELSDALRFAEGVKDARLGWIEEPLAADASHSAWQRLAEASSIPLAAGENMAGFDAFDEAIDRRILSVIQPDLAKWGGFSGCFHVARRAVEAGRIYCPHYLGGGIGLCASAHLLAAVGGPGLLEVDVNQNPLRQEIWDPLCEQGRLRLGSAAGLGIERLPENVLPLITNHCELLSRDRPC